MSETLWKWRIFLFIRSADATAANVTTLAEIYANNGSGETVENERRIIDAVTKFSTSGTLPAHVFGINLTAHTSMRDEFKALLDTLKDARYAVVANTTLNNFSDGELVLTNMEGVTPNGQIVTWDDAKQFIENRFGLIEIIEDATP